MLLKNITESSPGRDRNDHHNHRGGRSLTEVNMDFLPHRLPMEVRDTYRVRDITVIGGIIHLMCGKVVRIKGVIRGISSDHSTYTNPRYPVMTVSSQRQQGHLYQINKGDTKQEMGSNGVFLKRNNIKTLWL